MARLACLLFFIVGSVDHVSSWRIQTAEDKGMAVFYDPSTCPYYSTSRHRCFGFFGRLFNGDDCDCDMPYVDNIWAGKYEFEADTQQACFDECRGRRSCKHFIVELEAGKRPRCNQVGKRCNLYRSAYDEGVPAGSQKTRITHDSESHVTMPSSYPAQLHEWQPIRELCAPRCPEKDTVFLVSGGDPFWGAEAVFANTTTNWQECLQMCTGKKGHRKKDNSCQFWVFLPNTTEVEEKYTPEHRNTCITYTSGIGYRRPGPVGSYSGTRFTGSHECSAGCTVSEWTNWSECTVTCGGGTRTRRRSILHEATVDEWWDTHVQHNTPFPGDADCPGTEETISCNSALCPIPCEFGDWDTDWGEWIHAFPESCSHSCGGGFAYRKRSIKTFPQHGAKQCDMEDLFDSKECNSDIGCPSCHTGPWGDWSGCSKTCELGHHERTRDPVEPFIDGCAMLNQTKTCRNDIVCPVDCLLDDEWQEWSVCSKECDGGRKIRFRHILNWNAGGGEPCDSFEQAMSCNVHFCPQDCVVSDWGEWSHCTVTCGVGKQHRTRKVVSPDVGAGKPCPEMFQEKTCAMTGCTSVYDCYESQTKFEGNIIDSVPAFTPQECQHACWDTDSCNFFTLDRYNHTCKMMTEVSNKSPSHFYYMSGPRECYPKDGMGEVGGVPPVDLGGESEEGPPVGIIVGASLGGVAALAAIGGGVYYGMTRSTEGADYNEATGGEMVYVKTKDYAEDDEEGEEVEEVDSDEEPDL